MISLEGTILFFLIGCLIGFISARAAERFREGMGIGFIEPIMRIFSVGEAVKAHRETLSPTQKIKNIFISDIFSPPTFALMLIGGALFIFMAHAYAGHALQIWHLIFAALLIVISAVDQRQSFIPDSIVFILLSIGFLRAIATDANLNDAAIGFVAAHAMAAIIQSFFDVLKREGFYWGDLKFALALGVWIGFPGISWVLFIASFIGLVYGLTTRQRVFPFAPFMSLAAIIVMVFGDRLNLILSWG